MERKRRAVLSREERERSESVSLGLLASRARAALHRLLQGGALDEADTTELTRARDSLKEFRENISFASTSGQSGRRPRRLVSVGLAVGALSPTLSPDKAEEIAGRLDSLIEDLDLVLAQGDREAASRLTGFFGVLSTTSRQAYASPGETVRIG